MNFLSRAAGSALLAVLMTAYPLSSPAANVVHACANPSIGIKANKPVVHSEICDSAGDALTFFTQLNMELSHPLVIEIVQSLPDWMSESAVGCYQEEEQRVFVLTFSAFTKREVWFGVPVNPAMYRSLVTHEVAHAVASCNFKISEPTIHAEEYVAYVAMFAMMNPVFRARVLAANPEAGFDSESEINEITYSFDPMRFGVAAYRHYLRREHGDAFLLRVLSGNALTNSVLELP